jgi:hypothetical protein
MVHLFCYIDTGGCYPLSQSLCDQCFQTTFLDSRHEYHVQHHWRFEQNSLGKDFGLVGPTPGYDFNVVHLDHWFHHDGCL